jgi:hypothetical protein
MYGDATSFQADSQRAQCDEDVVVADRAHVSEAGDIYEADSASAAGRVLGFFPSALTTPLSGLFKVR